MIGKIVSFVLMAILVFAIYKYFDGNIGLALTTVGDWLWAIIDHGSTWVAGLLGSIF